MCGIAGKRTFDGVVGDRALIHAMCETIIRRGPDAEGIHVGPNIGIGQRRLAVIDIDHRSDPPLSNEDASIWIVFNGEIYNYRQLTSELLAKGHTFRTHTDTEVIVHLYEEYGFKCLERLEGMFAFAIWDDRQNILFAARDRFGKKPFYYHRSSKALVFGSAIRTVMKDPAIPTEPNYLAIDAYLTRQYVPSPETAFTSVKKLPAAHYLVLDPQGELCIRRYWSPPAAIPSSADYQETKLELRSKLTDSVRARMVADVPLGALLSGGIDSGLVVALMAEISDRPVKTFSIGFEEDSHNELPYARQVAERFLTDHTEYVVKPNVQDLLPQLVREYNEPFADSSAIPSFYVAQIARQHVTVALTGDGGDESFAGYEHYRLAEQWGRLDAIPLAMRQALLSPTIKVAALAPYSNVGSKLSRGLRLLAADWPARYLENTAFFKAEEKRVCYSPKFKSLIAESSDVLKIDFPAYSDSSNPLDWMMQHDQNHYLPDCLLIKADVAAMANSLELRSPFLDHRLVEFAATIPLAFKKFGHNEKRILRDLATDLLPVEIAVKKKTGFGIPLAHWLRTDLAPLMLSTLLDDTAQRRGLFNQEFIARMIREHKDKTRDWSSRLWSLMWLELWFREFVD
jgi:asparagine synthase (glutamine-hydrolysing)